MGLTYFIVRYYPPLNSAANTYAFCVEQRTQPFCKPPIGAIMQVAVNAGYFREKVKTCLQLAKVLPWNDPVRYQLLLMAEDFQKREAELENAQAVGKCAVKRETE